MTLSYYELLGVSPQASVEEIRTAYRAAMKQLHPDKGGTAEQARPYNDAWAMLSDEAERAAYDARLAGGTTRPAPGAGMWTRGGQRQPGRTGTSSRPSPGTGNTGASGTSGGGGTGADRNADTGGTATGSRADTDTGAGGGTTYRSGRGERTHTGTGSVGGQGWPGRAGPTSGSGAEPGPGSSPWGWQEPWGGAGSSGPGAGVDPWPGWDPWADWDTTLDGQRHGGGRSDRGTDGPPRASWGQAVPDVAWWARPEQEALAGAAWRVSPPVRRFRWVLAGLRAGWVAAAAGLVGLAVPAGPAGWVLAVALLACAYPLLPARLRLIDRFGPRLAVTIGGGLVLAGIAAVDAAGGRPLSAGLAAGLAVALVGVLLIECASWRDATLEGLVGREVVYEQNLFGTAGARLADGAAKFGPYATSAGIEGERRSDALLRGLLIIRGAKLIHGLPWPGHPDADVDHAVVVGNRIALIDSKLWPAGCYQVSRGGKVCRDGQPVGELEVRFCHAVEAWKRLLPGGTRVAGFLLAHPGGSGGIRFTATHAGSVNLLSPEDAAETIGRWLAPEAGHVNRKVLYRLLTGRTRPSGPAGRGRGPVLGLIARLRAHHGHPRAGVR